MRPGCWLPSNASRSSLANSREFISQAPRLSCRCQAVGYFTVPTSLRASAVRRMQSEGEEERRRSEEEEERERFMETVKATLAQVQAQRCSHKDLIETQQHKIASLEAQLAHAQTLLAAEREEVEKLRQAVELMRGQQGDLPLQLREANEELSSIFSEAALTEARQVLSQGRRASQVEHVQTDAAG
eukprot:761160-Hanusia_phi.AAC.1